MKKVLFSIVLLLALSVTVNAQTYSPTIPDSEVAAELDKLVGEPAPVSDSLEVVVYEYRVQSSGIREDLRLAFYGWIRWNGAIYKGLYDLNIILQAKGW